MFVSRGKRMRKEKKSTVYLFIFFLLLFVMHMIWSLLLRVLVYLSRVVEHNLLFLVLLNLLDSLLKLILFTF